MNNGQTLSYAEQHVAALEAYAQSIHNAAGYTVEELVRMGATLVPCRCGIKDRAAGRQCQGARLQTPPPLVATNERTATPPHGTPMWNGIGLPRSS